MKTSPKAPSAITWQDIPQFPRASYEVDVMWDTVERQLETFLDMGADLNPDYQRDHVWTEEQRVAWLEYVLRGGETGRQIVFACSRWRQIGRPSRGEDFLSLVDGKQRLETVRMFVRGELRVFAGAVLTGGRRAPPEGMRYQDFGGYFRALLYTLKFRVVETPRRLDVLNLYLNFNTGGTPHSRGEIEKVERMRDAELLRLPVEDVDPLAE